MVLIYLYLPYVPEQVELFPPETPHASSVLLLFCLPSHPKKTGSVKKEEYIVLIANKKHENCN